MNLELLKTRFDAAGKPDDEFLEGYNGLTIQVWKQPLMPDVLNYLVTTNGIWENLDTATGNESYPGVLRTKIRKFLTTVSSNIPTLRIKDGESEANLPGLLGYGIIEQSDADGFMDLARDGFTSQSLIDQERATTQLDLDIMRLAPKRLQIQALRAPLAHQVEIYNTMDDQCANGIDPGPVEGD